MLKSHYVQNRLGLGKMTSEFFNSNKNWKLRNLYENPESGFFCNVVRPVDSKGQTHELLCSRLATTKLFFTYFIQLATWVCVAQRTLYHTFYQAQRSRTTIHQRLSHCDFYLPRVSFVRRRQPELLASIRKTLSPNCLSEASLILS